MDKKHAITLAAFLAGLVALFLVSCGDDGGTDLPCENCDFWSKAFGGNGRFPSVSPVDPHLIAISSTRDVSGPGSTNHIWVVKQAGEGDTTKSYQITFDDNHDFNPAWSPDGQKIAFERNVALSEWQILVVDVSDLSNPGVPDTLTDSRLRPPTVTENIPHMAFSPSWVEVGGHMWISFCSMPNSKADSDIGLIRYPDLGDTIWPSIDPKDFADEENGVMSSIFEDVQASSNGTNLIAFASPSRDEVVDITVIAKSEEASSVGAQIFINEKDSGKTTPYTFRYRPAGTTVAVRGTLEGYCESQRGTVVAESDTERTYLIDFVHTHGTIGVRTSSGDNFIYFDADTIPRGRTPVTPMVYVFFPCMPPDTYVVWTEDYYGAFCDVDSSVIVTAGDTTFLTFVCGSGKTCEPATVTSGSPSHSVAGIEAPVRPMQGEGRGAWLMDLGNDLETGDDKIYLLEMANQEIYYPVLSPDSKYVAYIRGSEVAWDVVITDISGLASGAGVGRSVVIGLPGSSEDIECWRKIEKISWLPAGSERAIVASMSLCRGGSLADYEVWIADLSRHLE